jgi:hypothetical protein
MEKKVTDFKIGAAKIAHSKTPEHFSRIEAALKS